SPVGGGRLGKLVELVTLGHHAIDQGTGVLEDARLRPGEACQTRRGVVAVEVGHQFEGVEHLERPRTALGFGPHHELAICRSTSAVRRAASAASCPLLPALPPARAVAWAIVSHVSRPIPTGTSVSVAARASAAEV